MTVRRIFGLIELAAKNIPISGARTSSWLGRSVCIQKSHALSTAIDRKYCDPQCPKLRPKEECCREALLDDVELLTSPLYHWYPLNIYHGKIFSDHSSSSSFYTSMYHSPHATRETTVARSADHDSGCDGGDGGDGGDGD